MRVFLSLALALVLLLIAAGQMGRWHPAGDSLAVLQVPLVLTGLVCVAFVRWPIALRCAAALCLLTLVGLRVFDWTVPGPDAGDLVLYQKNLHFRGVDRASLLSDIARTAPDAITFQELSARNAPLLPSLRMAYPTQHQCAFNAVGETAVLSRFAAVPGSEFCAEGMAGVQVTTPLGPVWLISVHLHWPWPYRQAPHSADLLDRVASLTGRVVVGGDFNMVPWSYRMRAFVGAARGHLVRPIGATIRKRHVPLPIDHVIAPDGGRAKHRPRFGSDHAGILARVSLEAGRD